MHLYAILDRELLGERDPLVVAKELKDGGVRLIQYRDKISAKSEIIKTAERLKKLNVSLIINDYPEIAREVDAIGVHIGQDDVDIKVARKILGKEKIIGKSTHNLEQVLQAQKDGADYIGIGPIFRTNTKKDAKPLGVDILKKISKIINIPAFAIGGISLDNLDRILSSGINRVAVAGAILGSDNIKKTVREFVKRLNYDRN